MNGLKEMLIHPITDGAYKEEVYEDFVSREEFINRTGIFVTPEHFGYIYDMVFKESGVSVDEFIRDYEEKYSTCIQEVPLSGTFKYEVMDEEISCVGEYDDCYEPNIWEIVNVLSRNSKMEFESKHDVMEKYNKALHYLNEFDGVSEKMTMLTKIFSMLSLQHDILNGLLEQIINNETCAVEIEENSFLKDIWNITFNQLNMITDDIGKIGKLLNKQDNAKEE